jgi:hypothetical protein
VLEAIHALQTPKERAYKNVVPAIDFIDITARPPYTPKTLNTPKDFTHISDLAWDSETAFMEIPTCAYGKVEFGNDDSRMKPAKVGLTLFSWVQSAVHPPLRHDRH